MGYSFYDEDEDELNRYLERFASGGRDDLAYDPGYGYRASDFGGGGGGYGGGVSAPIPVREDKRSWMEKNGFPLLMAAGSVAAAFADKSGRRGQNVQHALGQIAGAQLQSEQGERDAIARDFELDRRAWQQQQGLDMQRDQQGRQGRYQDAQIEHWGNLDDLARGRLGQGGERVGIQRDREDRLQEAHEFRFDPNNPQTQAVLQELRRRGVQLPEGLSQESLKPLQGAVREDMETELAPQRAGEAADQAGRVTRAQTPGLVDRERQMGPVRAENAGNTTEARNEANAPLRAENTGRKDAAAHQGLLNKFRDETEKTRPQLVIAADMDALLSGYGDADRPGVGMFDSWVSGKLSSDDDLKVRNAIGNMTDLVARVRSGAAIPPPEFEKIASFVAGGTGATEQQFLVAWGAYKNGLRREMQQQAAGREEAALETLGEYGGWSGIKPPVRPNRGGSPTNPLAGPKPAAGGGMVRVTSPSGNVMDMPAEQAQRAMNAPGWKVEPIGGGYGGVY